MARKLYERQAVRRRNGQLANGVALVVYTDEAGTVLADVSATSGGSAIVGSSVTTADIAGLGPASLRFWGPTDGTDILYLRAPSDASLGVQKIEADPDPRLDLLEAGVTSGLAAHEADTTAIHGITDTAQVALRNATNTFTLANKFQANVLIKGPYPVINPLAYGTFTSGDDITSAMQSALTDAGTIASDRFGTIELPPGDWGIHELDWCPTTPTRDPIIRGAEVGSTRLFYNGAGGAGTYMFRNNSSLGGATPWGGFQNLLLDCKAAGGARAEHGFVVSGADLGVDWAFKVENFWVLNASGDALDFGDGLVVNLFMRRLRFDGNGGWAIRLRGSSGGEHRPILISEFTIDNTTTGGKSASKGFLRVDDGQGYFISIKHGRLEGNTNLVTEESAKQWIMSNDTTGSGPKFHLDQLLGFTQVADAASLLRDVTGTAEARFDACNLTNCTLFKDSVNANRNIPATSPDDMAVRGTDKFFIKLNSPDGLQLKSTSDGFPKIAFYKHTNDALIARQLADSNGTVFQEFDLAGDGGDMVWRSGVGFTERMRLLTGGSLELPEMSDPAAPAANKARLYVKDVGGKTALMVRFPTGAVQQIAIEP